MVCLKEQVRSHDNNAQDSLSRTFIGYGSWNYCWAARQSQVCEIVGLSERTLQRWQSGGVIQSDKRPQRLYQPTNNAGVMALVIGRGFNPLT